MENLFSSQLQELGKVILIIYRLQKKLLITVLDKKKKSNKFR
jgi:hypothetical protein